MYHDDPGRAYVYEPKAPFVHHPHRAHDPNAFGDTQKLPASSFYNSFHGINPENQHFIPSSSFDT